VIWKAISAETTLCITIIIKLTSLTLFVLVVEFYRCISIKRSPQFTLFGMFLIDLPKDVLRLIFPLIEGRHVLKLWLTGDSVLYLRMFDQGGVHHFYMNPPLKSAARIPSILPRMTQLLHLSLGSLPWVRNITDMELATLPNLITSLSLHCYHPFISLLQSQPDLALFSSLRSLHLSRDSPEIPIPSVNWPAGILEMKLDCFCSLLPLSTLPPHLTTLSIDVDPIGINGIIVITYHKGVMFPSTLTKLEFGQVSIPTDEGVDLSSFLPSGLLYLTTYYDTPLKSLPRDLIELTCPAGPFYFGSPNYFPSSLLAIHITRHLFPGNLNWVQYLPPSVTDITASSSASEVRIDQKNAGLFPRSLTRLPSAVSILCVHMLPLSLTELVITNEIRSNIEESTQTDSNLLSNFQRLPLKTLRLSSRRFGQWSSIPLLDHPLPTTLQSLIIDVSVQTPMSVEQVQKLPSGLLELKSLGNLFEDQECLHHLPQHLKTLDNYYPDSMMDPYDPRIIALGEIPTFLPKTLTFLKLWFVSIFDLPSWISHLPASLMELSLKIYAWNSPKTTTKSVVSYPAKLVKLTVFFESNPSKDVYTLIKTLPQKIEEVEIGAKHWDSSLNDSDLANLPSHLQMLFLPPSKHISRACVDALPESLTRFRIAGEYPDWFIAAYIVRSHNGQKKKTV
jgi:hypothetical protein